MTTPASRLVRVAAVLTAMMPCEATSLQAVQSTATPTVLLVHGGIESGRLRLNPSFVLRAPASLPTQAGPYRIMGTDRTGRELFSVAFAMGMIADAPSGDFGSFVFLIPAPEAWAGELSRITLTGPEGMKSLERDSGSAMAIVLDPETGQVRAILRDLPSGATLAERGEAALGALALEPGLDVIVSQGIPSAEAWKR